MNIMQNVVNRPEFNIIKEQQAHDKALDIEVRPSLAQRLRMERDKKRKARKMRRETRRMERRCGIRKQI